MATDILPDHPAAKKNRDQEHEIRITLDPNIFSHIDEAARYMQESHEEIIIQILKGWAKNNSLPLHGKDRLCTLKPDDFS